MNGTVCWLSSASANTVRTPAAAGHLAHRRQQRALADPGRALDDQHAALAAGERGHAVADRVELRVAPAQADRGGRATGRGPARAPPAAAGDRRGRRRWRATWPNCPARATRAYEARSRERPPTTRSPISGYPDPPMHRRARRSRRMTVRRADRRRRRGLPDAARRILARRGARRRGRGGHVAAALAAIAELRAVGGAAGHRPARRRRAHAGRAARGAAGRPARAADLDRPGCRDPADVAAAARAGFVPKADLPAAALDVLRAVQ